jgi:hypothetical protein
MQTASEFHASEQLHSLLKYSCISTLMNNNRHTINLPDHSIPTIQNTEYVVSLHYSTPSPHKSIFAI